MRNVRAVLGSAAAVCALGAFAAPALALEVSTAPEFAASKITNKGPAEFPLKLRGVGVGPQEFAFKKIHVVCQIAKATGTVPSAVSKTIALVVTYKECVTGPISIWANKTEVPMSFKDKSEYTLHFNGFVENEGEVEMKAKYLKCLVDWGSGVIPEKAEEDPEAEYTAVLYGNEAVKTEDLKHFPTASQHKLMISNQFKGRDMEWEEEGGGACEDSELRESEAGKYTGKLLIEVPGGNIETA